MRNMMKPTMGLFLAWLSLGGEAAHAQWFSEKQEIGVGHQPAPTSRAELCERFRTGTLVASLGDQNNRMGFGNDGGRVASGVCWWHSMFQRNALFTTYYSPSAPRPTDAEARRIFGRIRSGNQLVEVPGFPDLQSFTRAYRPILQDELEDWQVSQGVIGGGWIRGLTTRIEIDADEMRRRMDELYEEVNAGRPSLITLQYRERGSNHMLLVYEMLESEHGYALRGVDSNASREDTIVYYAFGDTSFRYGLNRATPELYRRGQVEDVMGMVRRNCPEAP